MSILKKHSLLIITAMLILLVMPLSFAAEISDNAAADVLGIDDVDTDVVSINDDSIVDNTKQASIDDITEIDDNSKEDVTLSSGLDSQEEILAGTYDYESVPNETEINYVFGNSYPVHLSFNFDGDISPFMEHIYAYVDGSIKPVEIKSPSGNDLYAGSHSGIVDIKSFSNYLNEGSNTVVFHPLDNVLSSNNLYNNNFVTLRIIAVDPGETPTVYYVDKNAVSDGNGSQGSTFKTVSAAITAANNRFDEFGTIIIKNGVYEEPNTISIEKNMEIKASGGAEVIIKATGSGSLFSQTSKADVTLSGLTFKDAVITSGAIYYQNTNAVDGSTLIIQNCNFINNQAPTLIRLYKTKATVKQVNFIKNTLTSVSDSQGGLINCYEGGGSRWAPSPYTFDVSYSNIIDNTNKANYIFTSSSAYQGLTCNYNYWGFNPDSKPTGIYNKENSFDGDGNSLLTLNTWTILNTTIPSEVQAQGQATLTLQFLQNDGTALEDNMADLAVDLTSSLGATLNPASVIISNNNGISTYTAPSTAGLDTISVRYDTYPLTSKDVNAINTGTTPEIEYTSTPTVDGNDSVEYVIGNHMVINIAIDSDVEFEGYDKLYVYIDGYNQPIEVGAFANINPETIDLKSISDKFAFVVGEVYTIYFHPDLSDLSYYGVEEGEYVFNPLTVTVIEGEVEPPAIEYTINLSPDELVSYTIGDSQIISVTANYSENKASNFESRPMYIYINGKEIKMSNVLAKETSFTFDLADYSDELVEGVNNISVHPRLSALQTVFYTMEDVFVLGNLTVNAEQASNPEISYSITPTPNEVSNYIKGNNMIIHVVANYTDSAYVNNQLSVRQMYVYINGEEISLNGIKANNRDFTFDLIDYNDKLVDGVNNISIHPQILGLSSVFTSGTYEINNLTVTVINVDSSYVTAPVPNMTDYIIGEDKIISVNVAYDDYFNDGLSSAKMFVYVNGEDIADCVGIDGVLANYTSFEFNLKDIADKLVEGQNNLTFHPHPAALQDIIGGPYTFNKLIVNVVPTVTVVPTYNVTIGSLSVDYIRGESCNVSVGVAFDDVYANAGIPVYLYVGDGEGILISGFYANDSGFIVDLNDYNDKLADGENILSFHPNVSDLNSIAEGEYSFGSLTVTVINTPEPSSEIIYTISPSISSVDYIIGESHVVEVNATYNSTYSEILGEIQLFVFINDESPIEINGITANVSSFKFDLATISEYLAVGNNIISFHPKLNELSAIGNVKYEFGNITVNAENAPEDPDTSYVTIPNPSKVDYTLNESSIVTITVLYDDYFKDDLAFYSMFVYINGEDIANRVKIPGIMGNATNFTFDLKQISDKLVEGQNNLTFHPHPGALEGTFVGPYTYYNLTVNVGTAPEPVNPVNKLNATIEITANNVTAGETVVINIVVPNNATGRVLVEVADNKFNETIENGKVIINVDGLDAGNYTAVVSYSGDDNYYPLNSSVSFNVAHKYVPVVPAISVDAGSAVEGDVVIVNVTLPDDATGRVFVEVAGKKLNATVENGKAIINVNGLKAGNYTAVVSYSGDDKYSNATTSTAIKVDAKPKPAPKHIPAINLIVPSAVSPGSSVSVDVELPNDAKGFVSLRVNGKEVSYSSVKDGVVSVTLPALDLGSYSVGAYYYGDDKYAGADAFTQIAVKKLATHIVSDKAFSHVAVDYTAKERGTYQYGTLLDENDNPVANKEVKITVGSTTYKVKTNSKGVFKLKINYAVAKKYNYKISFEGDDLYDAIAFSAKLTVTKKKTSISAAKTTTFKATTKTKTVKVTLKTTKNANGKTYLKAGKKITLKVNGKTYTAKATAKGAAKFTVKLSKKGTYKAVIKFAGDKTYKASSKNVNIKIK